MNIIEQENIRSPSGRDDICAKFTIDTVDEPFVLHDIAQVGQEYTLSFWAYSETDGEITAGNVDMPTSSDWTRYVVTFIADSMDVPIYFNISGTYYLYNTQLEIGCKATDFALNPADTEEDVAALAVVVNSHSTQFTVMDGKIAGLIEENVTIRGEYDTLVDRTADLELSLDEYKVTVSENYSTKVELETVDGKVTTLEEWQIEASQKITKDGIIATVGNYYAYQSDLDTVENRVTEAESQIIQHADEIALRVEKDGIINAINLSTEEVKIEAARITLAGATIADSFTATNLHITGNSVFDGTLNGATGSFSGSLTSTSGNIGGFDISSDKLSGANINIYSGSTSAESYIELLGAHVSLQDNIKISASGIYAKCWSAYATEYSTTYYPSGDPNTSVGTLTYGTYGIIKLGTYLDYPANKETTNITLNGLSGSISATGGITAGGSVNYPNYATGSEWSYVSGKIGIVTLSNGSGLCLYTRNSGSSSWTSSIYLADSSGVNLVTKSGGTFTGQVNFNGIINTAKSIGYYANNVLIARMNDASNYSNLIQMGNSDYNVSVYSNGNLWKNGSTTTYFSTTSSSDKRLKDHISDMSAYEGFFMYLKPGAFRYHDGLYNAEKKTPLTQWGFYAQDVITAFEKSGIDWTEQELVVVEDGDLSDAELKYVEAGTLLKMNYQNMTALNTHMIQKNIFAIEELKNHFLTVEARQDDQQVMIEQLMDENEKLKKRVAQLEEQQVA